MPRVGLPPKSAQSKTGGGSSASSAQLLTVAAAALAFRGASALVSAFCAWVWPRGRVEVPSFDFGLAPPLTAEVDGLIGRWLARPVTPALVIAWLAFAGGMAMLLLVARLDLDGEHADGAVLLAAVFPFAFVVGRRPEDALFLLFVLGAFYGFRRQLWIVGAVSGALATATLPAGILIVPALAWTGFRQPGARRLWTTAALVLAALGFGAELAYLYYRAGPPGGWAGATARWGFHLGQAPWLSLQRLVTSHPSPADALNGAVTALALASIPFVWWRLDGGYAIYMLAMLWLPLTSGGYDDLGRTCALLFPLFVLVASIRARAVVVIAAVTSAMFYALALAMY